MPTATKSKRVAFTFDERSLTTLDEIRKLGDYSSMAATIRDSLRIMRALQFQANRGFNEIVVRNPETGKELVLIIPDFAKSGG